MPTQKIIICDTLWVSDDNYTLKGKISIQVFRKYYLRVHMH